MAADNNPITKRRPAYFWWLVANGLALCFAVLSWTLCLYVFGNPEVPLNYRIMRAIGRAPEFKPFAATKLPNGAGLGPKELYSRCISQAKEPLEILNAALLRNYLMKYSNTRILKFVEGTYEVVGVRALSPADFLQQGVGIRLRAMVRPDEYTVPTAFPVVVDVLIPTDDSVPESAVGQQVEILRKPHGLAVIRMKTIRQHDEPTVCITAVPVTSSKLPIRGKDGASMVVGSHGPANLVSDQPLF